MQWVLRSQGALGGVDVPTTCQGHLAFLHWPPTAPMQQHLSGKADAHVIYWTASALMALGAISTCGSVRCLLLTSANSQVPSHVCSDCHSELNMQQPGTIQCRCICVLARSMRMGGNART